MRTELPGQLALLVLVLVDVVSPGKGLVTCGQGDFSGSIIRDRYAETATEKRKPYIVENEAGTVVGRARNYRQGAEILASHHGIAKQYLKVEIEHE